MNRGLHRLVFCRRIGAFVAVAETTRRCAAGDAPRRRTLAPGLAAGLLTAAALSTSWAQTRPPVVFAGAVAAPTAPLPQPYGTQRTPGGALVNDPALRSFVADPAHRDRVRWSISADGRSATLDQGDVDRVILNWDRFDIAAGHRVHFQQNTDPTRYVSALNRIWSADPSLILGSLTATREVILVNTNGVYFGRGAQVDTGKFVVSALNIADATFERGLRNVTDGSAVFNAQAAGLPETNRDAAISVEAGAQIRSAAGGDVLLIAPRVVNAGRIDTPAGQQVLAAGQRIYLMSSSDPAQRGLIVAVDPFLLDASTPDPSLGLAENRASGGRTAIDGVAGQIDEMRADGGTVNLVGLSVRQAGVLNATTAVKGANGVVMLQAMAGTTALAGGPAATSATSLRGLVVEAGAVARVASGGGTVELAAGSRTRVMPAEGGATQLAAEVFNPSLVRVEGERIAVAGGAQVLAPAGRIELLAASTRGSSPLFSSELRSVPGAADGSRIVVAPDAELSVAGLRGVAVDGARNQGAQQLFRIELADAPVQRDGPLYRSQVFFDGRTASGIDVANVSGAAAANRFTAEELSTRGGSLRIEADGDVVVGERVRLDVSGGSVSVSAATLSESLLVRDGALVRFSQADPAARYDALLAEPSRTTVPAYDEGRAGGELVLGGRRLAVAGELLGGVVEGERQAAGQAAAAAPSRLQVGRAIAGDNGLQTQYLSGIDLVATTPGLAVAPWSDPFSAPLDGLPERTALSLAQVQAGGFGQLLLRARELRQTGFARLDLGDLGSLDVLAKRVSLDGEFDAPGGRISLRTDEAAFDSASSGLGDIELSGRTQLRAGGLWSNPAADGAEAPPGSPPLNGGSVSIRAAHDLTLQPGARVDVSAGARPARSGGLAFGKAGDISLASGRSENFRTQLRLDGALLTGFDAGAGGRLDLFTPDLWIGTAAAQPGSLGFALDPGFFSAGGFGDIRVDAAGAVRIGSGTLLEPVLASWQATPDAARVPSGRMSGLVATAVPVDEALADRRPVNLSLAARRTANPQLGIEAPDLVVERGARIRLEDGGTLSLVATGSLSVGALGGRAGSLAELSAPGGRLQLAIEGRRGDNNPTNPIDTVGFSAEQALWLGADARLSVAGATELRPAPLLPTFGGLFQQPAADGPLQTGEVRGGGRIELLADRGYVVAEAGSQLRLDGAAAALSLPGAAQPVTVAKGAGQLLIRSPEGVVLDGSVSAQAPRDAAGRALADGGALELSIGLGGLYRFTSGPAYPEGERVALVGEHGELLSTRGVGFGSDLAAGLGNGTAFVPLGLLAGAGFDQWRLGAGDRIRFEASTRLAVPIAITLDAPVLDAAAGSRVQLAADTVALGDRTGSRLAPASDARAAAAAERTELLVQARTIDVAGRVALQGFSETTLDAGTAAGGELRLSAVNPQLPSDPSQLEGRLAFDGTLSLVAGRTYATTASLFAIEGLAGSSLALGTGPGGEATAPPLSVFGELVLRADHIEHRGVLWQPFGAITLDAARSLLLGEQSLTRVSGEGQTLLYGRTANLSVWQLPSQGRLGTDQPEALPLAKAVTLRAPQLQADARARIDVSGGGDVQAWEFFPGVGGSTDLFEQDGLFAVLPSHGRSAAVALNGGLVGLGAVSRELVVTMEGSGLPRGAYTLLPARYALLGGGLPQGAFLVRRAPADGSPILGAPQLREDGSVLVAASARDAGSVHLGAPNERWEVLSLDTFSRRSELRLSSVGTLLEGYADAQDRPVPPRPQDGGALRVQVGDAGASRLAASLSAQARGGTAGTLDIAGSRLALLDDPFRAEAGETGIEAASLANSGAASVLIGGLRGELRAGPDGLPTQAVDARGTQSLRVDLGLSTLALEELVLASSGSLVVQSGTLRSTGQPTQQARTLALAGDGALALISANAVQARREAVAGAAGTLSIGAAAALQGTSVLLDGSAGLTLTLALDRADALQAAALTLSAPSLLLGAAAAAEDGATVLQGPLLEALRASRALSLAAYDRIAFLGEQDWALRAADGAPTRVLDRLVLDAPQIASTGRTDIAAREIVLRNSAGTTAAGGTPPEAGSSLQLQALPPATYGRTGGLSIGPGSVQLQAAEARLRSGGDIVLDGRGGLEATGDLTLSAARLSAESGAEQRLVADTGRLVVAREAGSRSLGELVGLGAELTLSAQTLHQGGVIDLPSGALSLQASGSEAGAAALTLDAGSRTSVAGLALDNGRGFVVDSPAGAVQLQAGRGAIVLDGALDAGTARRSDGSPGEGDGGRVLITAAGDGGTLQLGPEAQLAAAGGSRASDRGGRIALDLRTLPDSQPLLAALGAGGVDGGVALRVREGELAVAGRLRAERIEITADGGRLNLNDATLDARAADGGLVRLSGRDGVRVDGASQIDVRATRDGARGGEALLDAGSGPVAVAASAQLQAGDGRITLRSQRSGDGRGLQAGPLAATALQAAEVVLEAVRVYEGIGSIRAGSSSAGVLGLATVSADNAAFAALTTDALALLGVAPEDRARFSLRAGVEVRSNGALTLASPWNLATERPGGEAGALTLRAAGSLTLAASLGDGFVSTAANAARTGAADTWALRLVAGADLGSADALATQAHSAADLVLAPNVRVRTGAASIELAAARDIVLGGSGTSAASVLVAGAPLAEASGVLDGLFARQLAKPRLTGQALRLELEAGRDIVAAESAQLPNNWLWRSGLIQPSGPEAGLYAATSQLAWWAEFAAFGQSLGAFGGAGLHVEAGRDIVNLQAMLPSVAWADQRDPQQAALQTRGGGDLNVHAGRDLLGGQYLVAAGDGRLSAGRSVGQATANTAVPDVLLAQLDGGRFRVSARADLSLGGSHNPTLAPSTSARNAISRSFVSLGEGAGLELRAAAGDLTLAVPRLTGSFGLADSIALQAALGVLPPTLTAYATGGALQLLGEQSALLLPEAGADLRLWATGDLRLGTSADTTLAMSDAAPATWPDFRRPETAGAVLSNANAVLANALSDNLPRSGLHAAGGEPVRVHAGGSIRSEGLSAWLLPKPARFTAGDDVLNLRLLGQNLATGDRTEVVAGRNLLAGLRGLIELGGPGVLDVRAGRDVDLGASAGIVSIGNRKGAALPAQGASVRVAAATAGVLDLDTLRQWRERDATVDTLLLAFVRQALQQPGLTADAAWAAFAALPAAAQAEFGQQLLRLAFRSTYLEGPAPTRESVTAALRTGFERRQAELLQAGEAAARAVEAWLAQAAAAGPGQRVELLARAEASRLALPGRDLQTVAIGDYPAQLRGYLASIAGLRFENLNLDATVAERVAALQAVRDGWQAVLAAGGGSADDLERYRERVLELETVATGATAVRFGRLTLPMRQAVYDQGFEAAELAGAGSFVGQPAWPGGALLRHQGRLDMTQSAVITERGGAISLVNPGGGINVGLKDAAGSSGPKGVIALGGGDVFGYARDDFQVNVQRVFVVGQGDLRIWSSAGDIDSGRGANTAVGAPPLAPRRSADGVIFEFPATTTGSGLAVVPNAQGLADGSVGLYPAFGEIRALDAFIRAPRIELGAAVVGGDNVRAASVSSASPPVTPPPPAASPTPQESNTARTDSALPSGTAQGLARQSLLTVELLGLGEPCQGLVGPALEECRRRLAAEPPRPLP